MFGDYSSSPPPTLPSVFVYVPITTFDFFVLRSISRRTRVVKQQSRSVLRRASFSAIIDLFNRSGPTRLDNNSFYLYISLWRLSESLNRSQFTFARFRSNSVQFNASVFSTPGRTFVIRTGSLSYVESRRKRS